VTKDAPVQDSYHPWTTYIAAREEARRRGDRKVGTEHLLLGLLQEPDLPQALGTDLDAARRELDALDDQALAALGLGPDVSVPQIPSGAGMRPPRPTLRAVLHDRLPLTPAAKTALRTTEKDMRRRRRVYPRQVLVALLELEPPDPAAQLLSALGVDRTTARARLTA
jgi:ATP-dependent Clp protease ATP-binding subunit ClpA